MLLIIVRHGEAEPKLEGTLDENRRLTDSGKERLRSNVALAKGIAGRKVDLVLTSPFVRARESAEIVIEIFGLSILETDDSLEPKASPYEVYRRLSKSQAVEKVVLVTHQPLASRLVAGLLNWNERHFAFSAGSIAIIEVKEITSNPEGVLLSLLPSHL